MGYNLYVVEHRSSVVPRDYDFFEWIETHFGEDGGKDGFIYQGEFEAAVKEEKPEWHEKYKEELAGMREQFKIERAKLPAKNRKYFDGFSFSVG